ncbi:MAG: hypothetical protein HQ530_01005 [Parcubacteria group bacterium]|nr:hypothetical protein [Parcubacteria group bacterium]
MSNPEGPFAPGGESAPDADKENIPLEIEEKYIIDKDKIPKELFASAERIPIVQGYLGGGKGRIRKMTKPDGQEVFIKTTKKRISGRVCEEPESDLTKQEFDSLWPQIVGKKIEKVRHKMPYSYHDDKAGKQMEVTIELDIFSGDLSGLITAEVEFDTEDEADGFVALEWFGKNVTEDLRYKNSRLAVAGREANRGLIAETYGE